MYIVLLFFIVFIFGAAIGSFISAAVYRMCIGVSVLFGRSACVICETKLKFYELVPIFSFLGLGGKCKTCKARLAWEYLLTELATGLFFVFIFFYRYFQFWDPNVFGLLVIRDWILIGGFIFIFIYDLKYQIIPDRVSIPLIFIIFGINLYLGFGLIDLLFAGVVGGWWFALQYIFSKGRWVGDGDIRIGVLLGVALSFPNILFALFLAYILGALVSIPLVLGKKKSMRGEIAFGAFLTVSGFVALYWGEIIISWYKNLL